MQVGTAELDAVMEAAVDKEAELASSLANTIRELEASQAEVASLRVCFTTAVTVCSRPWPDMRSTSSQMRANLTLATVLHKTQTLSVK